MKKLAILFFSVLLFTCSSDSDSDDDSGGGNQAECGSVTLSSVTQTFGTLTFNWQSQGDFNYIEIGYDATGNIDPSIINDPQIGIALPFSNSFISTELSTDEQTTDGAELNFLAQQNTTMSFYARGQCSNGQFTQWRGPIIISPQEFCIQPDNIVVFGDEVQWDYDSFITNPSFFQVEYGLQGFQIGSGTQINSNNQNVSGIAMAQGNIYDFYVRAFCDNNLGFGDWAGPFSYVADQDYNLCNPPSNVAYFVEFINGNTGGVRFEWDYNGESQFEYVLVNNNGDPNTGTINSIGTAGWPVYTGLSVFQDYDFYVRGVCADGTRTAWTGPLDVNI